MLRLLAKNESRSAGSKLPEIGKLKARMQPDRRLSRKTSEASACSSLGPYPCSVHDSEEEHSWSDLPDDYGQMAADEAGEESEESIADNDSKENASGPSHCSSEKPEKPRKGAKPRARPPDAPLAVLAAAGRFRGPIRHVHLPAMEQRCRQGVTA